MTLGCPRCSSHTEGRAFTFASCRKGKLAQATTSSNSLMVQKGLQWPKLMPCCTCRDTRASNWNERYAYRHLAGVGKLLSRRCSNRRQAQKRWREILGSQMRSKLQHGPDFDR